MTKAGRSVTSFGRGIVAVAAATVSKIVITAGPTLGTSPVVVGDIAEAKFPISVRCRELVASSRLNAPPERKVMVCSSTSVPRPRARDALFGSAIFTTISLTLSRITGTQSTVSPTIPHSPQQRQSIDEAREWNANTTI
jgi:hypothetical protein